MSSPLFKDQPLVAPIDVAEPGEAWTTVLKMLLAAPGRSLYYVTVRMTDPLRLNDAVAKAYDAFAERNRLPSAEGVAANIFPRSFYRFNCKQDRLLLYRRHSDFRVRTARFFKKHVTFSYFDRLINWQPVGAQEPVNQLEAFINRMVTHRAKREAWYFYPTIDPTRDLGKIMSGPCLTAIDLKYEIDHNTLNLCAFYRDHEFAEKAYGNYLGLAHLLEFLCDQTTTTVGAITCISLRARIGTSLSALRQLVSDLE